MKLKKANKIEEASILQVKYYLYFLHKKGVTNIKGKIDYPLLKQSVDIELNEEDIVNIEQILNNINEIVYKTIPPKLSNSVFVNLVHIMIYVLFKLIQERKLMKRSYYIYNNGMLKRQDNSIAFVDENGEKRYIPIETVNEIYVMSEMNFNTNLINYLSQYGVVIHFFNYYSFYTGTFQPREKLVSGNLLVNQVNHYTDNEKRLDIAKRFIDGR